MLPPTVFGWWGSDSTLFQHMLEVSLPTCVSFMRFSFSSQDCWHSCKTLNDVQWCVSRNSVWFPHVSRLETGNYLHHQSKTPPLYLLTFSAPFVLTYNIQTIVFCLPTLRKTVKNSIIAWKQNVNPQLMTKSAIQMGGLELLWLKFWGCYSQLVPADVNHSSQWSISRLNMKN